MEYKQVILLRMDFKLPPGKAMAQCGHAAVEAALRAKKEDLQAWRHVGMPKVVLKVADLAELHKYIQQAKDASLVTAIITDAGRTVVEPGTITCGAIGPAADAAIDSIVSHLKLV